MSTYTIIESATIPAAAERVYQILADYEDAHKIILPKPYFESMEVLAGGQGAGTVVEVKMNVFGSKQTFTLTASEPEPGRILAEDDKAAGISTKFIVDPIDANRCNVTIQTVNQTKPGVQGWIEKMINPAITKRIYRAELANLVDYVQTTT